MLEREIRVTEATAARVELQGISKSFPGVRALESVDFRLNAGEVHALLGENGAGKSTLIKVMTGAVARDSGTMLLDGEPVDFGSPAEARALGISTVYQEVNLIPTMSVTKNLTLERQPRRYGFISWRQANARARERLKRLNLDIDVERPLAIYSVAIQQLVAIARALEEDTRVLVLDEPTASLDAREAELLFSILRDLKARGIAIVFITHFIDQVYQIADRISVLRNGRHGRHGADRGIAPPQADLADDRPRVRAAPRRSGSVRARPWRPASRSWPWRVWAGGATWAISTCNCAPEKRSGSPVCSARAEPRPCKLVFGAVHARRRPDSFRGQADRAPLAAASGAAWTSGSAPRIARPTGSFPNSPCAKTSCSPCRSSAACPAALPHDEQERSPRR